MGCILEVALLLVKQININKHIKVRDQHRMVDNWEVTMTTPFEHQLEGGGVFLMAVICFLNVTLCR